MTNKKTLKRENVQERAKQKEHYKELYDIEKIYDISVRKDKSKEIEEILDSNLEKYIISLEVDTPIIQHLYKSIADACPDLTNKKQYHLYWRYSTSKLIPITNYLTYVTALQLMANKNNNLFLIPKNWNADWLDDPNARYVALPGDIDIVNMIAPKESIFTIYQEEQLMDAKKAGITEYNKNYKSAVKTADTKTKKSKSKSSKESSKKKQ